MSIPSLLRQITAAHPLDIVEEVIAARDGHVERTADDELIAEVPGGWCSRYFVLNWCAENGLLQLTCAFDVRVPRERKGAMFELLSVINERLGLGHFEITAEGRVPAFRHAMPLRGAGGATVEQMEDVVDIALREVERYYPAFQYVAWGGGRPADAMASILLEPIGEA
jgi:hypothetical protein